MTDNPKMAFRDTHPFRLLILLVATLTYFSVQAKVFERCELARELIRLNISHQDLGKWLCIAEHESRYNTSAVNLYNWDGSVDNGLFQINNRYWCEPGGANVCKIPCSKLRDDDITDDMKCALHIKKVHGMHACKIYWERSKMIISDSKMIAILIAVMMAFQFHRVQTRIFSKCEFLAELKKQNIAKEKLTTYMCIADMVSNYNTKTLGRSVDCASVGIFQVNDRYWCSSTGSKNYCEVPCYHLLDDDVSDDIRCAQLIETQEGFKAWEWALKKCEKKDLSIYTSGC